MSVWNKKKKKKYTSHNWCDTFWNNNEDKGEREWNPRHSIVNDSFTYFDILNLLSYQRPMSCRCLFLITPQSFISPLPLINSVLFLSKIYLELSPRELSIYFSLHSLLILIWCSSVNLIFSNFIIKTVAPEAELPKLGRNSLSSF